MGSVIPVFQFIPLIFIARINKEIEKRVSQTPINCAMTFFYRQFQSISRAAEKMFEGRV